MLLGRRFYYLSGARNWAHWSFQAVVQYLKWGKKGCMKKWWGRRVTLAGLLFTKRWEIMACTMWWIFLSKREAERWKKVQMVSWATENLRADFGPRFRTGHRGKIEVPDKHWIYKDKQRLGSNPLTAFETTERCNGWKPMEIIDDWSLVLQKMMLLWKQNPHHLIQISVKTLLPSAISSLTVTIEDMSTEMPGFLLEIQGNCMR